MEKKKKKKIRNLTIKAFERIMKGRKRKRKNVSKKI